MAGFYAQNGKTTADNYDVIYNNGTTTNTQLLINEYQVTKTSKTDDSVMLRVQFRLARQEDGVEANTEKLSFNGTKFNDFEQDGVTALWTVEAGETYLDITLSKALLESNDKNTVSFCAGLEISSMLSLTETFTLLYNDNYAYWMKDRNFNFPSYELAVTGMGAPRILADGSFVVTVEFNKTLTEKRLQNFTASFETLLAESAICTPGYYYTSAIIDNIVLADIPNSVSANIKINGVSIAEMLAEGAGMVELSMYGSTLMVVVSASSSHKISTLDEEIIMEVGAGVRSYQGGETEQAVSYTYHAGNGVWAETVEEPNSSTDSTVDGDSSGALSITTGCGSVTNTYNSAFVGSVVLSIVGLKRRKEKN